MANILHYTEQFENAYWTGFDTLVVTPNTHAAPAFAGVNAGMADTVEDASASVYSSLFGTFETIPNDSSEWIASVYIRKDAVTSRFPAFAIQFQGGTNLSWGASMNTATGAFGIYDSPGPTSSGVEDIDAEWWRWWVNPVNNSSGNTQARMALYPAAFDTSPGVGLNGGLLGSIVPWGINLTNTAALDTYDPEPFYAFTAPAGPVMMTTFLQ